MGYGLGFCGVAVDVTTAGGVNGAAVGAADCVDGIGEGVGFSVDAECETSTAAVAALDIEPEATVPPNVKPPAPIIPPYASPPVRMWSNASMTNAMVATANVIRCGSDFCNSFMVSTEYPF